MSRNPCNHFHEIFKSFLKIQYQPSYLEHLVAECLFKILHGVKPSRWSEKLASFIFLFLLRFFYVRYSIRKGGVYLAKEKVTLRIEKGELDLLNEKYNTDNQSESIRLAIVESLLNEDNIKVKTLFPYVGKKPPRIGKEVAEAFRQSGCSIFMDLFCGSIAMLCYLPWDTSVVVNDINGNLTNFYMIIRDSPSAFVSELMKLPYSEVLFQEYRDDLRSGKVITKLERAVKYYYVSFGSYRGRVDNPLFQFSACEDANRADTYQKNMRWIIALSKRLQNVVILNRDFREVLKSYDKDHVFVYADCPYLGTEGYYDYVFTREDHKDLAVMLKKHKGKFALSSKAKRELRKLYRSNRHYMLEFEETKRLPDKRHREQEYLLYHFNNIGSTSAVTDMDGTIVHAYSYGTYGELLSGNREDIRFLYNGRYGVVTDENGLYYMRARYYNVDIKRFINQDVVEGSIATSPSLNQYAYCQGNPVKLTDPFGLSPFTSWSVLGHGLLDVLGFIPVIGAIPDTVNALWYLAEGDHFSAAASFVSAVPGWGDVIGAVGKTAKGCSKVSKMVRYGSKIVGRIGNIALGSYQTGSIAVSLYDKHVVQGESWDWDSTVQLFSAGLFATTTVVSAKGLKGDVESFSSVVGNKSSSCFIDNRSVDDKYFDNGERVATTKQIRKYKKQMNSMGINVVVDKKGKVLNGNKVAGFDYSSGTIYIKKKAGVIDLYHEGYHAKQYLNIGQKEYIRLGQLTREEYVYSQIKKNSDLFNAIELQGAKKYIKRLRKELN